MPKPQSYRFPQMKKAKIAFAGAILALSWTVAGNLPAGRTSSFMPAAHAGTFLFVMGEACPLIKNCALTKVNSWMVDLDGSNARPLINKGAYFSSAFAWSPDGSKIAFESDRPVNSNAEHRPNIWLMNDDGSGATPLTGNPHRGWRYAAWSHDGAKIASLMVQIDQGKRSDTIWVMNADGSEGAAVTTFRMPATIHNITWSPDDAKLAFASDYPLEETREQNRSAMRPENIWVMNTDGSGLMPVTKFTDAAQIQKSAPESRKLSDGLTSQQEQFSRAIKIRNLAWSPDGRNLMFASNCTLDGSVAKKEDGANIIDNIWVAEANGSRTAPLTRLLHASAVFPDWSREGSKIIFSSNRALNGSDSLNAHEVSNIWLMNADGSAARPLTMLTAQGSTSFGPAWSPDGTMIAFFSSRPSESDSGPDAHTTANLWVMEADGTGARAVTQFSYPYKTAGQPRWRP